MIERTISQSMYDAAPAEHAAKLEEVKETIYHKNLDSLTCRMSRKKAQGTWTGVDQAAYDRAYLKCSELIAAEEAKPIFNPNEKLVVVSDEEYSRQEEEERKRREEEQKKIEEQMKVIKKPPFEDAPDLVTDKL